MGDRKGWNAFVRLLLSGERAGRRRSPQKDLDGRRNRGRERMGRNGTKKGAMDISIALSAVYALSSGFHPLDKILIFFFCASGFIIKIKRYIF